MRLSIWNEGSLLSWSSSREAVPGRRVRWRGAGVLVLLLLGLVALLVWRLTAERRAVMALAPQERAAVYAEAWRDFQTLCHEGASDAFTTRCREQAAFLVLFPECDAACVQETSRFLRWSR